MKAARALRDDPGARAGLRPVRLVLLSSFTTQLLDAVLKVEAASLGLLLDVHHGGFGQFEQLTQSRAIMIGDRPAQLLAPPLNAGHIPIVQQPRTQIVFSFHKKIMLEWH